MAGLIFLSNHRALVHTDLNTFGGVVSWDSPLPTGLAPVSTPAPPVCEQTTVLGFAARLSAALSHVQAEHLDSAAAHACAAELSGSESHWSEANAAALTLTRHVRNLCLPGGDAAPVRQYLAWLHLLLESPAAHANELTATATSLLHSLRSR